MNAHIWVLTAPVETREAEQKLSQMVLAFLSFHHTNPSLDFKVSLPQEGLPPALFGALGFAGLFSSQCFVWLST